MSKDFSHFTASLQEVMTRRCLSKRVVAQDLGVSVQAIERYLIGKSAPHPSLHQIILDRLEKL